ncbi:MULTISPECIES: hypothetical protein [unclassified Pannonibacter]|uniref:hypothetical protein n=1 Tax=unclassified Pannonibacter TaxID=2627228 RepID=UPI001648FFE7|nr:MULTISPECIES: hypothetical protein [unclassified Pannonibacter]
MDEELRKRIEVSRAECLKRFDAQTEKMATTIARQVAQDAANAGQKGLSMDEAIQALEGCTPPFAR